MKHLAGEDRNPERDGIGPKEMSTHLFNAHWQYKQFRKLKLNLPVGCVLTLKDFAEN